MTKLITVVDDFCPEIDQVRQSAIAAGFGTWAPNKGEIGSSVYEGMSFWGDHSFMVKALVAATGGVVLPNAMFFRVTNKETEKAYVHSDRMTGSTTCVAYLSDHSKDGLVSGTGFFRHRATGLTQMPTFQEMRQFGMDQLKDDMVNGGEDKWEQIDFVRGLYNRAVIFHAPLFHSRVPNHGIGTGADDGRMVWACHFRTLGQGGQMI